MAEIVKRGKYWYYRFTSHEGRRVMRKGCADRRVTEQMATAAELEAAKVRAGLVDPKETAYRDHEATPLVDHLAAYSAHLADKGRTVAHVALSVGRVRRVIALFRGASLTEIEPANSAAAELARASQALAQWIVPARLSHLTAERVQKSLRRLREEGRSLATCNHHATAVCAFAKWCYDTHRLREYPLRGVEKFNAKEDRRHDRRTVSLDELCRLVEVAHRGRRLNRMTGPMRALCYRLASATGLRFSEIKSITPGSFDWEAPSVTVAAAYTKNGDPATLPLPRDLADDLAAYVATLEPGTPVFPLPSRGRGAEMLRVDLEAAGIPYRDAAGLVFDFHSLRCETATLADQAGVSPRVVQRLMRHSTLELTGRYTKPRAVDIDAAASLLPSLKPKGNQPEVMGATGTDGRFAPRLLSDPTGPALPNPEETSPERATHRETFAPSLRLSGDGQSRTDARSGGMTGLDVQASMQGKSLEKKALDGLVRLQTRPDGRVPKVGLEPTPPCGDRILSPARLPFRHFGARSRSCSTRVATANRRLSVAWASHCLIVPGLGSACQGIGP